MTDQQHVITPPPELVEKWLWSGDCSLGRLITITSNRLQDVATQAAQWGADMELEACCHEVQNMYSGGSRLRATRHPKPLSLREQALSLVPEPGGIPMKRTYSPNELLIIHRALEALPND